MGNHYLHDSFIALLRGHERAVYKICYLYADTPADRQDLYQEIVLQVWNGYEGFRGEAKFSTWLYQVALNTAITWLRKEKRGVVTYIAHNVLPDTPGLATDTNAENLQMLDAAINQLNAIEKALVMLYLDEKSYDEMESIMGISSGALRTKMTRIKDKLKTITKNDNHGT